MISSYAFEQRKSSPASKVSQKVSKVFHVADGLRRYIALIGCIFGLTLFVAMRAVAGPTSIILDTDMGPDCDDVGALFALHGALQRGEIRLIATMGCVSSDAIAPCLDAMNTWFGHAEIPVGTLKDAGFLAGPHYTAEIARNFPHKQASGRDYPDAVALYRQVLAGQPDGNVVVVAIGPLRNLANLLKSGSDGASPLDGKTLVAQKVKRLIVMGGRYGSDASAKEAEWNFAQSPASAALVCATWPSPILFNGDGGNVNSGRRVTYEMPEHNPLAMAYRLYPGVGYAGDRLSWDPITCLVAAHGAAPWYTVVEGGHNVVDPAAGGNTWQPGGDRQHAYLVRKSATGVLETALEDLLVAGKGHPTNLRFNTAYYAPYMCTITARGAVDDNSGPGRAFDRDERTAWRDRAEASWIQCQYVDGRKYAVSSYALVCTNSSRLPRTMELSGSNDGGATWKLLDTRSAPGFTDQVRRREFSIAHPTRWNAYRLSVTASNADQGIEIATIELNQQIDCRPGVAARSVALDRNAITVPANGRVTLNATLLPDDTFEREVAWTSSDPSVAEVRHIGEQIAMVIGHKVGRCSITATVDHVQKICPVTVSPPTLPAGWSYDELNRPAIPGSVAVSGGTFSITGCGHSMTSWWERVRDQGVFTSRAVTGNVEISARFTGMAPDVGGSGHGEEGIPPAASGLMIREALTAKCGRYLLVQVTAHGQLVCRWRDRTGDQDDNQAMTLGRVRSPVYLKLIQSAGQLRVYTSTDGQVWGEPRFSHAAPFDTRSRIGLFVCSGCTFASTTATYDSVTVK